MTDVLGYLQNKGLTLKQADARNVHLACFFCSEDPSTRGRLYVNVDPDAEVPGLYMCHLCGAKGNLASIKRHFGDQVGEVEADPYVRAEIMALAAAHYSSRLSDYPEVVAYLTGPERGLRPETIEAAQLGYAPMAFEQDVVGDGDISVGDSSRLYGVLRDAGFKHADIIGTGLCQERRDSVFDALQGMVTIPYLIAGNVVTLRGRTWPYTDDDFERFGGPHYARPRNKYKTLAGSKARLFNVDVLWNADNVLLTEGEFDSLVMNQYGYPAVGVPGATAWQDHWDEYFDKVQRVWIVFDRDTAGERAANRLLDRLGPKARALHLSEEGIKCDPTEWFANHGVDEFDALMANARRGGVLVSVDEARAEFESIQGQPGLRFAWELLDVLIAPGLQASQLMVVLAKTNTGKTVFLLNLMHRVRMVPGQENLKILFVSLEQTRGEWWDRARRIHTFHRLQCTEEDAAAFWRDNLLVIDRNRLSETQLRAAIDDYVYDMGALPDLVCLDYLGYFARGFKGESYQRTSDAAMAIKAIAKDYRIPFIVPQQVSRTGIDGQEFAPDSARDSVAGETLITLANGEREPIASLVGTKPEVVVLGPDLRFRTRPVERVWCKGVRALFEVTTRTGRKLRCTSSHPFFTVGGWRNLAELQVGSAIAVPRDLPVSGSTPFAHAELIGSLIADGCLTRSPITFTKAQADIRARVSELVSELGITTHGKKGEPLTIVCSHRSNELNPLTEYVRDVGAWGYRSPDRRVPNGIWTSPLEDVAAFVRGLWSCDGTITNRGLKYASASEALARDLQALLLRFGIVSTTAEERYSAGGYVEGTYWTVSVRSAIDIIQFAKWIGLIGGKGVALDQLALDMSNRLPDKWDSLPAEIWSHLQTVRRHKRMTWAEAFGSTGTDMGVDERRGISRARATEIAGRLDDRWLADLAQGHLRFDPIVSIMSVGEEPVYDMSVVGIHNFVANEIVVANSGVIEETADFLLTMWTPDNTLGREEEERSGKIHLRIGKSRHGGRGALLQMQFAPISLALVPEGDPLCARARQEVAWKNRYRDDWSRAVHRHRTGAEGHLPADAFQIACL